MRGIDGLGEAVVSIQVTGMEQAPWEGHRAAGLLATEDLVLVPDAPDGMGDAGQWFDVLVIPTSGRSDQPVERIGVAGIEALRRTGDGRVTTAVLKLDRWSRYPAMISSFDGDELSRQVAAHDGDVWTALLAVGAIAADRREVPDELLRVVPDMLARWRAARVRSHEYEVAGEPGWNICSFLAWPCQPRST